MPTIKHQQGVALLAVLVAVVLLTVLIAVVAKNLDSRISIAEQSKLNLVNAAEVDAKVAELTYVLATQRMSVAGVSQGEVQPNNTSTPVFGLDALSLSAWSPTVLGNELRTDGYLYLQEDGLTFSIQNQLGLVPFNSSGQFWLKKLLSAYQQSASEQARLADILADYADADNWRRPAGAEGHEYTQLKLPLPPNFLLQHCAEVKVMAAWQDFVEVNPEFTAFCSLGRAEVLNLNVIPVSLWEKLWPDSAKTIQKQRQQGRWLVSKTDILATEPSLYLLPEDYFTTLGGAVYQIKVSKEGQTRRFQLSLGTGKLTPFSQRF
jgi:general secretion pathway protein K